MTSNYDPEPRPDTYRRPTPALYTGGYASFLLGTLDERSNANGVPFHTERSPYLGIFFHDDWKISRRLTLNLGVRYEWESGPYDDHDIYSRYLDLSAQNPDMQKTPPNLPTDLLALCTPRYNGQWVFTDNNNRKAWTTQKSL